MVHTSSLRLPSPSWRVLLVAVLMASSCTGGPGPGRPSASAPATSSGPPASGRLVFHSDPGGADDLYAMNGDGSNLVQLTHRMETSVPPVWSPDGSHIALVCCLPFATPSR